MNMHSKEPLPSCGYDFCGGQGIGLDDGDVVVDASRVRTVLLDLHRSRRLAGEVVLAELRSSDSHSRRAISDKEPRQSWHCWRRWQHVFCNLRVVNEVSTFDSH
jgi:hypothetical protein